LRKNFSQSKADDAGNTLCIAEGNLVAHLTKLSGKFAAKAREDSASTCSSQGGKYTMEVGRIPFISAQTSATSPKTAAQQSQTKSTTYAADNADKYVPEDKSQYSPTYQRPAAHKQNAENHIRFDDGGARSVKQMANDAMKGLVQETLSHQANRYGNFGSTSSNTGYQALFGQSAQVQSALAAAEKTSEKHDDYWGVDATAERIYTFARSLAGDNDEMFDTMKNAFLKGFDSALSARRGGLPSISYQTKDRVLEMFGEWEKEIAAKSASTPAETATETDKAAETESKAAEPDAAGFVKVGDKGKYYKPDLNLDEKYYSDK
jgi:hypothetical protein